jgi:hypothetical protein
LKTYRKYFSAKVINFIFISFFSKTRLTFSSNLPINTHRTASEKDLKYFLTFFQKTINVFDIGSINKSIEAKGLFPNSKKVKNTLDKASKDTCADGQKFAFFQNKFIGIVGNK